MNTKELVRLRALEHGVTEERIAATLSVDVCEIRKRRDLLSGICAEAVTLLRQRNVAAKALREIKRATPMRQIEMAELMVATNNYSADYARCLIAATSDKQLIDTDKSKVIPEIKAEDVSRMEREMEVLGKDFLMIEESHGKHTLNLVLRWRTSASGWTTQALSNTSRSDMRIPWENSRKGSRALN